MPLAPDLRPRTAVELYDAAIHLCTRGGTAAPALAFLGAAPVAIAGVALCYQARFGRPTLVPALAFTLALFFRSVCLGAAAVATQDALGGTEASAAKCLVAALKSAPALCVAGAVDLALRWIGHPITLGLAFFFWSDLWCGPAVVLRGRSSPWLIGGAVRRELGPRSGSGMLLRLMHALAFLIVALNTWVAIMLLLYLGHAFFGLDVTFLEKFCMPDNWLFDVVLLAITLTVLEPVRAVLGPLLLADARVRIEGLDLREAVERLSAAKLAVVLIAVGVASSAQASRHPRPHQLPPHTRPAASSPAPSAGPAETAGSYALAARLQRTANRLGVGSDERVEGEISEAENLGEADRAVMQRFLDRIDQTIDSDETGAKAPFLAGLSEAAKAARATASEASPKMIVQEILARPEFVPTPEHPEEVKPEEKKDTPNWLQRVIEWLWKQWEKLFKRDTEAPVEVGLPGLSGGFFHVLVYVIAGLAAAVLLWLIARVLLSRDSTRQGLEDSANAAGGKAIIEIESALSHPPHTWWEQAEFLAACGDHRGAIRSIYLALLAALHARGAIDYDPNRSNWDYCRRFRGEPPELESFRELTLGFDFAWYGSIGATADGYDRFRSLAQPLIAVPAAAA
jgi:hypothetical protein